MYFTYILQSQTTKKLYKGHTSNLSDRLNYHNTGKVKSTKNAIPWKIVYYECFSSREDAIKREKYFKAAAGRRYIKNLKFVEVLRPPQ